jgi:hypothetical protein
MTTVEHVWQKNVGLKRAWYGLAIYNVVLGGLLAGGGQSRVQGPSFALVRTVGGPGVWGALFIVGGLAIGASLFFGAKTAAYAMIVGAVVHGWFATQFLAVALTEPNAALTGVPTYLYVAWVHAAVAIAYQSWDDR